MSGYLDGCAVNLHCSDLSAFQAVGGVELSDLSRCIQVDPLRYLLNPQRIDIADLHPLELIKAVAIKSGRTFICIQKTADKRIDQQENRAVLVEEVAETLFAHQK